MVITDQFLIKASLHEEAREGWVWINKNELNEPKGTFIKIFNPKSKKFIICDCRIIDENFKELYDNSERTIKINDEPTLIIHEYYRKILEIDHLKNQFVELKIEKENNFIGSILCNWNHPNPNIRASYRIGLIGLLIAIATPLKYLLKKIIAFFWHLSCC